MDEMNKETMPEFGSETTTGFVPENAMENTTQIPRQGNPRRKKKSQMQIFKETYLPLIIAGVAAFLILVFLIGSVSRAIKKHRVERDASIAASESLQAQQDALDTEAKHILETAAKKAAGYDFVGAIAAIDSFSGDIAAYEELMSKRAEYQQAMRSMTEYNNPNDILNLSFQVLVADPERAFADDDYGSAYHSNFVTVAEFNKILQELYANNYMLVSMDDFITTTTDANGQVSYAAKTLYLPAGKKPVMITQTQVNYYTYMVDSDGDGIADKDGAGFASKLVIGTDGKLTCEMIDAQGNKVYGAYDLVPILNDFIATHPDFSLDGAKATLAVTGFDGLFGYRTDIDAKENLDEAAYNAELQGAMKVINALRQDGYTLACYTYNNIGYGDISIEEMQDDMNSWITEVTPLLGQTDTLVYAVGSDIADSGSTYSGEAYDLLSTAGFRFFLGFCDDGDLWTTVETDYVRQGRILVSGDNLIYYPEWFSGIFDPEAVLDAHRYSE